MKKILLVLSLISLTACQTPPRFISNHFNSNDPCQSYGKPKDYQKPNWCGSSQGQVVNVNQGLSRNNYIVTVK